MAYSPRIILTPFGRHDSNLTAKADVEADRQVSPWQAGMGTLVPALIDYMIITKRKSSF